MKPEFLINKTQLGNLEQRWKSTPTNTPELVESSKELFNQIVTIQKRQVILLDEEIQERKLNNPFIQPHPTNLVNELLFLYLQEIYQLELAKYNSKDYIIETCILGSCQYSNIADSYYMYKSLYEEIAKYNLEPTKENNMKFLFKVLGVPYEGLKFYTKDEQVAELNKFLSQEVDSDDNPYKPINSIEEFYQLLKDEAWDLWGAYIHMFEYEDQDYSIFLEKLDIDSEQIGLCILMHEVFYETKIETFADFDT